MEFHEINDSAGRPHEEIGADEQSLEPIDPPPCQHANRRINLSTVWLSCADCGEQLLDLNPFLGKPLKVQR